MLNIRPSRDLRNNYADVVKLLKQHDHVIITNNGVGEAALINLQDYEEYLEYRQRRYIFEELQKSKAKANDPDASMTEAAAVFSSIKKKLESKGL